MIFLNIIFSLVKLFFRFGLLAKSATVAVIGYVFFQFSPEWPLLSGIAATATTPAKTQTAPAKPAPAAKPDVARTWLAKPARFDGQAVATFVSAVDVEGMYPEDAAFVVLRVTTADQGGKDGGAIFLLLPPNDVQPTIQSLKPPDAPAGRRTAFGTKQVLKRLDAVLRVVGGEAVLVKGGDVNALKKIGKPSAVYAAQLKAGTDGAGAAEVKTKYPKQDFFVSQVGRSGRSEKQVVMDRLLKDVNQRRKEASPKAAALSAYALKEEIRKGAEYVFDDDATKTTWRIVWQAEVAKPKK